MSEEIVNFPSINTAKTKSHFDYSVWQENSLISMFSVPWDYSGEHVIKWSGDNRPEDYFVGDNAGISWVTTDVSYMQPHYHSGGHNTIGLIEGKFRIEVPFEQCVEFNYVVMRNAMQPVVGGDKPGKYQWYYFIKDFIRINPSVTEIVVEVDNWTNFYDTIKLETLQCERTTYARRIAKSPAQFLADPVNNTAGISNVEDSELTRPIGSFLEHWDYNSEQTLIFAANNFPYPFTADFEGKNIVGEIIYPTFLGKDVPNQLVYFVLDNNDIQQLRRVNPLFMKEIAGLFVAPTEMLELGDYQTLTNNGATIRWRECLPRSQKQITPIHLSPDDFGYPERYAGLTKLYTSPYAILEVRDGIQSYNIRLQDLSAQTALLGNINFAFPFLRLTPEIIGVAGDDNLHRRYDMVVRMADKVISDGVRLTFDIDLPIYEIAISPHDEYLRNAYNNHLAYQNRDIDYAIATIRANTTRNDANDNADTARDVTNRNADLARDNAVRTANANHSNQVRDANNRNTNSHSNNQRTMDDLTDNFVKEAVNDGIGVTLNSQNATASKEYARATMQNVVNYKGSNLGLHAALDIALAVAHNLTKAEAVVGSLLPGGLGIASTDSSGGGGTDVGVDASANSQATGSNSEGKAGGKGKALAAPTKASSAQWSALTGSGAVALATTAFNLADFAFWNGQETANNAAYNSYVDANVMNAALATIAEQLNELDSRAKIWVRDFETDNTIADNDKSTAISDADTTQGAAVANANEANSTAHSNSAEIRSNARGIAARDWNAANDIRDWNYKRVYNGAKAGYDSSGLEPTEKHAIRRTSIMESQEMGVRVILRRIPDDLVAQIGERMLRTGYVWEGITPWSAILDSGVKWDYVKATNVVVKCESLPTSVALRFKRQLENGMTLWASPQEMGDYNE